MSLVEQQPDSSTARIVEDDDLRSQFMRGLIAEQSTKTGTKGLASPPRLLVQFWDDATTVPADVQECLDSWAPLEDAGFERQLFDDRSAFRFINKHFDRRHVLAFERCQHPAMRADYFRLCFMSAIGGIYVDADDAYQGLSLDRLFDDGRLKLQPLCYDITTDSMTDPFESARSDNTSRRIYYVNNNPLIAPPGHPIVVKALGRATESVLAADENDRDIQSLTGPGNLTACLVGSVMGQPAGASSQDFELIADWDVIAVSKWPLSYRSDGRNWRQWTREAHQP